MRFSEAVRVAQDALQVRGVNRPQYAVHAFGYDPLTFTATWTLAAPVAGDKLLLAFAGSAVTDLAGNPLPAFARRANVLPGDVSRDGVVNASDLVLVRTRIGKSTTNPGDPNATPPNDYTPFHDVNGDGVVNASDLVLARNHVGKALPTTEPAPPPPPPTSMFSARRIGSGGGDEGDEVTALL